MHRSFWPRHLSHANCWGLSLLDDFPILDPDSNPEKQLEESGRGILDVIEDHRTIGDEQIGDDDRVCKQSMQCLSTVPL
jgi:hypothetical protein